MSNRYRQFYLKSVAANLRYWHDQFADATESELHALLHRRRTLFEAVDVGLRLPDLWPQAAELVLTLFSYIDRHGLGREWRPLLELALRARPADLGRLRVQLQLRLGQLLRETANHAAAKKHHCQALELAQQLAEPRLVAHAHWQLGSDYLQLEQPEEAMCHAQMALTAYLTGQAGAVHVGAAYNLVGQVYNTQGAYSAAAAAFHQALVAFARAGTTIEQARVHNNLGQLFLRQKEVGRAVEQLNEAQRLLAKSVHKQNQITVLLNLGVAYYQLKNYDRALLTYQAIDLPYLRGIESYRLLAMIMQNVGNILVEQAQYKAAEPYLREALTYWEELPASPGQGNSLGTLGQCLLGQGRLAEGCHYLQAAILLLKSFPNDSWAQSLLTEFVASARDC